MCKENEGFVKLPKSLFDEWGHLSPVAKSALIMIRRRSFNGSKKVQITNEALAKAIGVGRKCMPKHLKTIETLAGYSRRLKGMNNGHSCYEYEVPTYDESKNWIKIHNRLLDNPEWASFKPPTQILYIYYRNWCKNAKMWSSEERTKATEGMSSDEVIEFNEKIAREYSNREEFILDNKIKDSDKYKLCGLSKSTYIRCKENLEHSYSVFKNKKETSVYTTFEDN